MIGDIAAGTFWLAAFVLVWPRRATRCHIRANHRIAFFYLAVGVVIWLVMP
jgi:hypothetical protein